MTGKRKEKGKIEERKKGRRGRRRKGRKEVNIFKYSILKIYHKMISSSILIDISRR